MKVVGAQLMADLPRKRKARLGTTALRRDLLAVAPASESSFVDNAVAKVAGVIPSRKKIAQNQIFIFLVAGGTFLLSTVAVVVMYCTGMFKSWFH